MSRIQFKDNTEKNTITFQQEDLSCETGANFQLRRQEMSLLASSTLSRSKKKILRMISNERGLGVCPVLGMGYRSGIKTVLPPNPITFT